jgi:hypothetical protein
MDRSYYIKNIEKFAEWYKSKHKIPMEIKDMLEEPFLSRLNVLMEEENEKRRIEKSESSKSVNFGKNGNRNKKGYVFSKSALDNSLKARIGKPSWNKGITSTEDTKSKISDSVSKVLKDPKNNPNSILIQCPDGKVTSAPWAKRYCEKRGLDYSKCIRL